MNDPWAFGWTHVLTITGQILTFVAICVTGTIGFVGLRTFGKWRREKIEEAKIDAAVEGLALAYEAKTVFEDIRAPLIRDTEWEDMPGGGTDAERRRRGSYYATFKRIESFRDFFDRLWKLQPRFMAIFGPETEAIFNLIHTARRDIALAAEMLADNQAGFPSPNDHDKDFWIQLRTDLWRGRDLFGKEGDRVGRRIVDFRTQMEHICNPVIGRYYKYKREKESHWESFVWALKNH